MPDEPTLGEVMRAVTALRDEMRERDNTIRTDVQTVRTQLAADLQGIRAQVAALPFVDRSLWEAENRGMGRRLDEVEDRVTWTQRTAVAGLLLPIVVGVIVAILALVGGGQL